MAAIEGHKEVVEYLITQQAEINYKDADGRSTLYVLALENNLQVAHVLLENGVDVSGRDFEGRTTLHVAAWQGHYDMVQLLINYKADVNATDNDSRSVLQSAAWQGHANVVRLLLENGASVDQTCNQGATALCIAAQEGHEDVVRVLLTYEANPNHADQCGRSATRVALKGGHQNVVKILEEYGATPLNGMNGRRSTNSNTTSGISTTLDSSKSSSQVTPSSIPANEQNLNCNNSAYESPSSTFERGGRSSGNLTASNTGSTNQSSSSGGQENNSLTRQPLSFTQQLQQCSRHKNRPLSKTLTPVSEPYVSPNHDNSASGSPMSDVQGGVTTAGPVSPHMESPRGSVHKLTSPRLEFSSASITKSGCHGNSSIYHRTTSVDDCSEPVWQKQSDCPHNAAKAELHRRGTFPDMPPMIGGGIAMGQKSLALKSPETRRKRNGIVTNPNFAKTSNQNKNVSMNGYFNKLSDLDFAVSASDDSESSRGSSKKSGKGTSAARPTGLPIKKETPI